ncbi:MAG TPA: molybdopterin cofactor-binding domain-containing protein [Burkholderiales bacterium]|nr:molybdopterin cofactor-binding domain-containing protein [Burkholderiales bacterium]
MSMEMDRREFLKSSGALMVSVGTGGTISSAIIGNAAAQAASWTSPDPELLDSWLALGKDGAVTVWSGKVDHGQGLSTSLAQIVAEELDVEVDKVTVLMGDTVSTCNQGGASGSTGIRMGGNPLRNAAAEARRLIVVAGAEKLGVPPDNLVTENGYVAVRGDAAKRVSYGDLFGERAFGAKLQWNKEQGNTMNVSGQAKPKPTAEYKVVGKAVPRKDIPGKILGTEDYLTNARVQGMLHGRMIRPPVSGAVPVKVDASSIASIRGARVVHKDAFLAVVANTEWDAIKAARGLKVEWSAAKPNFPGHDGVHDHIRKSAPVAANGSNMFYGKKEVNEQPALEALKTASRVIEAEYECAFQSHARMAPSVGIADVRDGTATIWTDTQKPHFQRLGISKLLGIPEDKVRVFFKHGAGSYGRSDADEAAFEAAVLSREVGRPVRVQWSRAEGIAWDPKAPAAVVTCKAGLDSAGNVSAWYYRAKGFSGWDVKWTADGPEQTLAGQQLGHKKWNAHNFDVPSESYAFATSCSFWQTVMPLQSEVSPLRAAHMRAPQEFQTRFAQESFVDEVASATGQDPLAWRLKYVKNPREAAVLKAVAEKAGWGPADWKPRRDSGPVQRGRGLSMLAAYGSFVAVVAEVEVQRATGKVAVKRVTVANDSGTLINPGNMKLVIEGNVIQGMSRTLHEEVTFDRNKVTAVDWATYPIVDITEAPQAIDIVFVGAQANNPGGAGEPALVCMPSAIANAIYNATGARLRRFPFTAQRVKQALTA